MSGPGSPGDQGGTTRRLALWRLAVGLGGLAALRAVDARGAEGPLWLGCRADGQDRYDLAGIDASGTTRLRLDLPGRGHGIALHPTRPEGVVFARQPGTFAIVFDHAAGVAVRRIDARPGRHFYGHGCFSADGRLLITAENDIEAGHGVLGLRDATDGYRHLGELDGAGIGPHELALLPGSGTLALAVGGIRTHPDDDRRKLNLATMRPSLALLDLASGRLLDRLEPPASLFKTSMRHLAVDAAGRIAIACQYEGAAGDQAPLLALHGPAGARFLDLPEAALRRLKNYVGSVAFDPSGRWLAASSPKGGVVLVLDLEAPGSLPAGPLADVAVIELPDGCGVAAGDAPGRFIVPAGSGRVLRADATPGAAPVLTDLAPAASGWDNHARASGRTA